MERGFAIGLGSETPSSRRSGGGGSIDPCGRAWPKEITTEAQRTQRKHRGFSVNLCVLCASLCLRGECTLAKTLNDAVARFRQPQRITEPLERVGLQSRPVQNRMRLFIATTFPADVLRVLNDVVARVKTRLPPSSWVRPESQHLTFAFLGEQDEAILPKLGELVEAKLAEVRPFEAQLRGCGFFPNSRNARVAWVGVNPEEQFREIADAVRAAVTVSGVKLDGSDFKAHLTLCRLRDHWPPACIEIYQKTFGAFQSSKFNVDHVTLYSSQLDPKGAIHTPLREFSLARPLAAKQ